MLAQNDLLRSLFQQEFAKMVAVISRHFGLAHIEVAEDIASETFLQAAENWEQKGLPPNPAAWLYAVAKQKALHHFRRAKILNQKLLPAIKAKQGLVDEDEMDFSAGHIRDSLLQMLFAVCHPALAAEAQMGLALRVLCGFGIDEIAEAFFTNKETVMKRLVRAKEKLRTENVQLTMPSASAIDERLNNVLHVLYLLFNEGYCSTTQNQILRKDLCHQALHLALTLAGYERTARPKTKALIALMCFHASRFDARLNESNGPIDYEDQDEALWNKELIQRGCYYLLLSADGDEVSTYHLEAKIACCHCLKKDSVEKWKEILHWYNQLLLLNYSPSVAISRTFALYKAEGAETALKEAEKLKLESNASYYVLLGELYKSLDVTTAVKHFASAFDLTKTETAKAGIQRKITALLNE